MATLYTVLCALQAQVSAVTQGLVSNSVDTNGKPLTVQVGLYWPSAKTLQNNVRPLNGPSGLGPTSLVTVYDRGLAADSTRWLPQVISQTLTPATMTVTLSERYVQQLSFMTLTFGGPVTIGDAVGIVLTPALFNAVAVVAIAVAGDTPTTMAAKAAALLNANPTIAAMATATVVGPVLTLTSLQPNAYVPIQANVGNGGTRSIEVGRRKRHFQIVLWARSPDDRITVGDPIESLIAGLEYNFGLTFPDGTMGRLTFSGDTQHDEATLSDTLRRDFMVCVDYGINITDAVYAVLAPIVQNTTF
jgi:hypothetical protein